MLNIIRADIWKVFRSKSLYIILAVLIIAMLIAGFVYDRLTRVSYETYMGMSGEEPGLKLDILDDFADEEGYYRVQLEMRNKMNAPMFYSVLSSQPGLLFFAFTLMISLFIAQDYSRGYLKNMLIIPGAKVKWILSKLLVSAFIAIVFLVVLMGSASIMGLVKTGTLGFTIQESLPFMLGQFGVLMVISALQILLIVLFQQTLPAILIGVVVALNLHTLALTLIDNLKVLPISLSENNLMTRVYQIALGGNNDVFPLLLLSLVYITLGIVIANIYFRRSDIRC